MTGHVDIHAPAEAAARGSPGALLSPEASAAGSRRLRHWRHVDRTLLVDRVTQAAARWARDWRLTDLSEPEAIAAFEARCDYGEASAGRLYRVRRQWQELVPSMATGVWWAFGARADAPSTHVRVLEQALYGTPPPPSPYPTNPGLADELTALAWRDWIDAMSKALLARGESARTGAPVERAPDLSPWDGTLRLRLKWLGHDMDFLLSNDAVRRCVARDRATTTPPAATAPGPRPVPVLQAVSDCVMPVSVELAPVDVALGALKRLKPGDLLCTTHPLSAPLRVRVGAHDRGAAPLCDAFLGRAGRTRAIELVRVPSTSTRPSPSHH